MRALRFTAVLALMVTLGACGQPGPAPGPPGPTSSAPQPTATSPTIVVTTPPPTTPAPTTSKPTTPKPTATPTTPKPTATHTTPPPPFPPSLRGQDFTRIPTTRKVVALTFDAGANADAVPSILATLAQQHVTATFFLTGNFVRDFPGQARQIVNAGHRIGNHSVNHPYFTDLTDAQIRAQLSGAAQTIRSTTGANPAPFFRFPYGDRDARTIATVNAAGYVPIRWTVDSLGWQGTQNGARDAAYVANRVLAAATPGEIVLMHVGSNPDDHSTLDAAALPTIIAGLRAKGYTFVTLNALLG